MKKIKLIIPLFSCIYLLSGFQSNHQKKVKADISPCVSFTFDDGITLDQGGYALEKWNQLLLDKLAKHNLKAILFSKGENKSGPKGKYLLQSWNDAGHRIANHTMTHKSYNSGKSTLEFFKSELLANDSLIRIYSNYLPYFRFPFLKEGDSREKVDGFRNFMKEIGYKNGHVTIDASDWYIDGRLVKRLNESPKTDLYDFREFYVKHLFERAEYYESLSFRITGRHIKHVILLHHNLSAALFLDDLIWKFKTMGWKLMDADKAYSDEIYKTVTPTLPAGESLIWSIAKATGKFENELRYPAEDGDYEKEKMDVFDK